MVGHPEVILRPPVRARPCLGELRQPFPIQRGTTSRVAFTYRLIPWGQRRARRERSPGVVELSLERNFDRTLSQLERVQPQLLGSSEDTNWSRVFWRMNPRTTQC